MAAEFIIHRFGADTHLSTPNGYNVLITAVNGDTMPPNPKLELTWIGKGQRPRLEPRILLEDTDLSHHTRHRVTGHDTFDNLLIHGDNLLALKALEQDYAGKVKCVFIDPPYNTGSAFPTIHPRSNLAKGNSGMAFQ